MEKRNRGGDARDRVRAIVGGGIAAALILLAMPSTGEAACALPLSGGGPSGPGFPMAQLATGSFSLGPGTGPFSTSVSIAPFDTSLGTFGYATFDLVGSGVFSLPIDGLTDCAGGVLPLSLGLDIAFDNGVSATVPAVDLPFGTVDVVPGSESLAAATWSFGMAAPEAWLVTSSTEVAVTVDAVFTLPDEALTPGFDEAVVAGDVFLNVYYFYAPPGFTFGPGGVLVPIGTGGGGDIGGPTPGVEGVPSPESLALFAGALAALAWSRAPSRRRARASA